MSRVNKNLVMQARRALYQLKRDYGGKVDIYKLGTTETDVRTGQKTIVKTLYEIPRGIVMPVRIDRTAVQSIALISSNKQFVSGGTYDVGTRDFIIDRRDCPDLPSLSADDWLVYSDDKYQIKTVTEFEAATGWVITAKKLVGERPEKIIRIKVDHLLNFTSTASAVVE